MSGCDRDISIDRDHAYTNTHLNRRKADMDQFQPKFVYID